jgi:hypothetical protein
VQLQNKVSCETAKPKFAFPESVAERGPSWFCKLCKLEEMSDKIQCRGCRGLGPPRVCKGGTEEEEEDDEEEDDEEEEEEEEVQLGRMHLDDLCMR